MSQIVAAALVEAIDTMKSMTVNEGQASALDNKIPQFVTNAEASVEEGWTWVDCDPYCDFLGIIIEEGNFIMEEAYRYALEIQESIELFF